MSEFIGSETHIPARPGIIKERVTDYKSRTTVSHAACSTCGDYIPPEEWSLCSRGDLVCKSHRIQFDDKAYCLEHFGTEIMSETEYKVFLCFNQNANPKKYTLLSKDEIEKAYAELEGRGYLVVEKGWLSTKKRISDKGMKALRTAFGVYRCDLFERLLEDGKV